MPTSSSRRGRVLPLPDGHEDRGLYVVSGSVAIGGQSFEAARMMVFRPGDRHHVTAGPEGARLMLLGGETLGGPRYIWWNFVASVEERIEAAKEAWRAGDFNTAASTCRRATTGSSSRCRGDLRPAGGAPASGGTRPPLGRRLAVGAFAPPSEGSGLRPRS